MNNHSKILMEAYEKFLLPLGGKIVPTPYRINVPYQFDRKKYGKSDAQTLVSDTKQKAYEQKFNLEKASVEAIRKFMEENKLGIDCSGFAYHLLDHLLKRIGRGGMINNGFPKASSTNVAILTSDKISIPLELEEARPGDLIKLNSEKAAHVLIILECGDKITYTHSSRLTNPTGVHTDQIINSQFPEDLKVFSYNEKAGDGIRRLKILSQGILLN